MKGPIDRRAVARRKYPRGKALARIEYFETQRGLSRIRARRKGRIAPRSKEAHYASATKAKANLAPTFEDSVALPVWRSLGPNLIPHGQTYGKGGNNRPPVSGRCVGILISRDNPQHLVLCSGGGGLWGTMDQGQTWHPLTDQQPVLSMGAIAAAPSSPNIVYAGTGEGDNMSLLGVGLLRSSDGGQTWLHVPSAELSGVGVYDIAVDPNDPLHVWVGTTKDFLESTDGGNTWRTVLAAMTWDISAHPTNSNEVFAATAKGLLSSANGGKTWKKVTLPGVRAATNIDRMEVCHAPSNPDIVYVAAVVDTRKPLLWRRSANGGPFASQKAPPMTQDEDISQAWYDFCFAISPVNPDLVFWGAVYLYKGTLSPSGFKWQEISAKKTGDSIHGDQHHLAFDPSDPNVLYSCNDGGIFRSPDNGVHWKSLNPGLCISEFEFIVHLESQDKWLIGGTQDNGTLGNPKDHVWKQIALGDGGDCGADDVQKLCYHSYYDMWIERAAALGPKAFHWVNASPPFPENYSALFYPPMDVQGSTVAKAGVTLFVSEDTGKHWNEVDFGAGSKNASAVVIVGPNQMFIGSEGGLLVRIDRAGDGWAKSKVTKLTSPRKAFISDIVIPQVGDTTIWVSSSAFGGGHVFRSTDGGKTWADCSGNLPDMAVNAIVVDPDNLQRVFAATDHGVYRTENAGQHWTVFSNGLPNVVVGDMILHERLRLLRIGTRNRGAWEVNI